MFNNVIINEEMLGIEPSPAANFFALRLYHTIHSFSINIFITHSKSHLQKNKRKYISTYP